MSFSPVLFCASWSNQSGLRLCQRTHALSKGTTVFKATEGKVICNYLLFIKYIGLFY